MYRAEWSDDHSALSVIGQSSLPYVGNQQLSYPLLLSPSAGFGNPIIGLSPYFNVIR